MLVASLDFHAALRVCLRMRPPKAITTLLTCLPCRFLIYPFVFCISSLFPRDYVINLSALPKGKMRVDLKLKVEYTNRVHNQTGRQKNV